MALVLDIETYKDELDDNYKAWKKGDIKAPANYSKPESIAKYMQEKTEEFEQKMALSPLTGKIILAGLLTDNKLLDSWGNPTHSYNGKNFWQLFLEGDEKQILQQFWQIFIAFTQKDGTHLVTYNGKDFDLPFILHRSALLKVQPEQKTIVSKLLNKYDNQYHVDLFKWFGSGSLVEWSYRMGLANSLERDGGKIGGWYEAGQMDIIKEKNSVDLFQSYMIYDRIKVWL